MKNGGTGRYVQGCNEPERQARGILRLVYQGGACTTLGLQKLGIPEAGGKKDARIRGERIQTNDDFEKAL